MLLKPKTKLIDYFKTAPRISFFPLALILKTLKNPVCFWRKKKKWEGFSSGQNNGYILGQMWSILKSAFVCVRFLAFPGFHGEGGGVVVKGEELVRPEVKKEEEKGVSLCRPFLFFVQLSVPRQFSVPHKHGILFSSSGNL